MATMWWRATEAGKTWGDKENWRTTETGTTVPAAFPGASDYAYFSNTASAYDCVMAADHAISIMYATSALTGGTDNYAANFDQAGFALAAGRIRWNAGGWKFGAGQLTLTTADYSSFTGCTITPGTGTTILNGCTTLAGLLFYNVSVAATAGLGTVTLSGKLKVVAGQTATISTGDTVRVLAGGSLEVEDTGELTSAGTGKLQVFNTAAAGIATTGTISCLLYFECGVANCAPPARTYGGGVWVNNDTSTERTLHLETGTYNFSSFLYPNASSTANIVIDGSTHNPTVNVTGLVDNIGAGSGSESWLLGSGTWTVGGGWDMNSGSLTAGTSTVVLNGGTKNWAGGTQTWNNVTISGNTTITGEVRVNGGTVSVGDSYTLTPNATLRLDGSSALNLNTTGTLASGTGYLNMYTGAWANVSTGGTLSAMARLLTDYSADNVKIPARTWGGTFAILHNRAAGNNRIVIMGTGASQTLTFSSTFNMTATGAGNITLDGATYNPTVNITGAVSSTKSSTGTVNWLLGTGTWTCGGNANWTGGTVTPSTSTLAMTGASAILTSAANNLYRVEVTGDLVEFADLLTTTSYLKARHPVTAILFKTGVVNVIADFDLDGTGGLIYLRASSGFPYDPWALNFGTATPTKVTYVRVFNCDASSGTQVDADDGTNTDSGSNTNWRFTVAVAGGARWHFARRRIA